MVSHHSGVLPFTSRVPELAPHPVAVPCPHGDSWCCHSCSRQGQSQLRAAGQSSLQELCASLPCSVPRDHIPEAGEDGAGAACEELPELHGVSVALLGAPRGIPMGWHCCSISQGQERRSGALGWTVGRVRRAAGAFTEGWDRVCGLPVPVTLQGWGRQSLLPRELLISAHAGKRCDP